MHDHISERDWKVLRDIEPLALDLLDEVTAIANEPDRGAHTGYGKIYDLIKDRDKDIADAFNDMSRSKAPWKLAIMERLGLINKDELDRFGKETHDFLAKIKSLES
jgi:hypothetical protein